MATQPKTDQPTPAKVNIDPYFETLFGKNRSRKRFCINAALDRLLKVHESDETQRTKVTAILVRAAEEGRMTDSLIRARYERHVMPPADGRRTVLRIRPAGRRKK